MTLELKKFDMKSISFKPNENKGPVVVLIGKRDWQILLGKRLTLLSTRDSNWYRNFGNRRR